MQKQEDKKTVIKAKLQQILVQEYIYIYIYIYISSETTSLEAVDKY